MAMRIDFSHSVVEELRRILSEQVEFAADCLGRIDGPTSEDAVHELRKTTKKVRAILRALSKVLPREYRRCQVGQWKRIADAVANSRDSSILEQHLKSAYSVLAPDADVSARPWERLSLYQVALVRQPSSGHAVAIESIRCLLSDAAANLRSVELAGLDFPALLDGSILSYRKGRRWLETALQHASPANLHQLRKRVKDHQYQSRLFVRLAPKVLAPELQQIERLADLLGEHHDLALLLAAITAARSSFRQLEELPGLLEWVTARMTDLEHESLRLAKSVFSSSPRVRAQRLRALYRRVAPQVA